MIACSAGVISERNTELASMPPSWIVTGCLAGRAWCRGGIWVGKKPLPPLPPYPFSPLNPYSLGEYLLAPILESY